MKTILVIEDDPSVRESLTQLLSMLDYDSICAANGLDGLKLAKDRIPDLILCDISMPHLDGYDVLIELSKDPKTLLIPFIFLTAKTEITDIRKGMELGADDYLLKPFTMSDLMKSIDLRFAKRDRLLKAQEESLSEVEKKKLTHDSFIIMMVGNHPESVKIKNIIYIEALENYSRVYTLDGKKLTVRKLMKEWDEILPEDLFLRIHRSFIINLDFVQKFEKWFNNSFQVFMKSVKEPFTVSRRYASKLRNRINL